MSNETLMVMAVVVVAVVVVVVAAWIVFRRRKTAALRARFGPEYDHVLQSARTPADAEQELLNRQSRVEKFAIKPLSREDIRTIVDLQVNRLAILLERRGYGLAVTDAARAEVANRGYDPANGARPLKRVIQQELQNRLATELLRGNIPEESTIRIDFDGECWQDTARNVFLPAWRRPVGFVFQDTRLFGHLDVAGNLRYAASRSTPGSGAIRFEDILTAFDLAELLPRRVDTLSGGERQRVAIARTLLTRPRIWPTRWRRHRSVLIALW